MPSDDPIANLYNLCNVLVGTTKQSEEARSHCAEPEGRGKLCDGYGVPWEQDGDPGYKMVFYEYGDDNFDDFIKEMTSDARQTMVNEPYTGTITRKQVHWQATSLFQFLYQLTQDPELNAEFHKIFPGGTPDQQNKFLEQHVKTNNYGEWQAIKALLNEGQDDRLAETMSTVITSFWNNFRFA